MSEIVYFLSKNPLKTPYFSPFLLKKRRFGEKTRIKVIYESIEDNLFIISMLYYFTSIFIPNKS